MPGINVSQIDTAEVPTYLQHTTLMDRVLYLEENPVGPEGPPGPTGLGNRAPYVVVAASNSTQDIKDTADFVCTGTDDQTTINAALVSAYPTEFSFGPGAVYLAAGLYSISGSILLPSAVSLGGSGIYSIITASVITVSTGAGTELAMVKLDNEDVHGASIHDVLLRGNGDSGGACHGIYMYTIADPFYGNHPATTTNQSTNEIYRVSFASFNHNTDQRNPIFLDGYIQDVSISDCSIGQSEGYGILTGLNTKTTKVRNTKIQDCIYGGMWIQGEESDIQHCQVFTCGNNAFHVDGDRGSMSNCKSQDTNTGFRISGAYFLGSNLTAENCQLDGFVVDSPSVSILNFNVLSFPGSLFGGTCLRGVTFSGDAGVHEECLLEGRVRLSGVTTKISGTPGEDSYVRILGGAIYSVG